jgi:opacity protein-like surface antigen
LLFTFEKRFHPYVLAGLGGAYNKASNYSTSAPAFLTFTRMYAQNDQFAFSYALGLGIDVDINRHTRLGLGYRLADLGYAKLGNATINRMGVGGHLSTKTLLANQVLAQITWLI